MSIEVEGGLDYARLRRHYPLQDYHEETVAAGGADAYIVGTNMGTPGWGAKDVLLWGDQDFFISFNTATVNTPCGLPLLIRIPANTYMRFHPHDANIIYYAATVETDIRIWLEG